MNILELKEDLKRFSPKHLRIIAREGLKLQRRLRNFLKSNIFQKSISESYLADKFAEIGIEDGDVLLVHSSLSRLGQVNGGAEIVVSALLKTVGTKGTIGCPTFWGNSVLYISGAKTYDVLHSTSILGSISEAVRKNPMAVRSLHPTHSVAFIGPLSEFLTSEHHYDNTPIGVHSPYYKLTKVKGKILLLGVTLEYLTSFHTIEDIVPNFPVKVYLPDPLHFKVIDRCRKEIKVQTYVHCPATGSLRQCIKMKPFLKTYGIMKELKIGESISTVIDAKGLHEALLDLSGKGITMYSPLLSKENTK